MKRSTNILGVMSVALLVLLIAGVVVSRRTRTTPVTANPLPTGSAAEIDPTLLAPLKPLVQERMEDPEYVAGLKALTDARREKVLEVAAVRSAMKALTESAAAALTAEGTDLTEDAIRTRALQDPQWPALAANAEALQQDLDQIALDVNRYVRDRMAEQYAMRRQRTAALVAAGISPTPQPRPTAEVRRLTNEVALITTPTVITNRPGAVSPTARPRPVRTPVVVPRKTTETAL
jgi:hypothetical protein